MTTSLVFASPPPQLRFLCTNITLILQLPDAQMHPAAFVQYFPLSLTSCILVKEEDARRTISERENLQAQTQKAQFYYEPVLTSSPL